MLALVLPALAATIVVAIAICGWFIFKPEPPPPAEKTPPPPRRPPVRR